MFPENHEEILAGLNAFSNFMSMEFYCSEPDDPTNDLVQNIIEEIVEYEVPADPEKKHLFMDVFMQFSDDFGTFGRD